MDPLVSVVIPTYYRNDSLPGAIESVENQTYGNLEVVVVDDTGEDNAREVVQNYDVEYVAHDHNQGGNGARNTGFEVCDGEYVQLLDDDDRLFPEKVRKHVDLLESDPDVGVAYSGVITPDGDEVYPDPDWPDDSLRCALQLLYPGTFPSSMLIDAEVFRSVSPLQARDAADDIGTKIELATRTEFDYVDELLTNIGASEDHRSDDPTFSRVLVETIEQYDHLYDRYPPSLRRAALCFAYEAWGGRELQESFWSSTAIVAFAKAAYYAERGRVGSDRSVLVPATLASVFGRPGVDAASLVRKKIA
jgi:glycosyltransferase involved in cell wall biosynthesis